MNALEQSLLQLQQNIKNGDTVGKTEDGTTWVMEFRLISIRRIMKLLAPIAMLIDEDEQRSEAVRNMELLQYVGDNMGPLFACFLAPEGKKITEQDIEKNGAILETLDDEGMALAVKGFLASPLTSILYMALGQTPIISVVIEKANALMDLVIDKQGETIEETNESQ